MKLIKILIVVLGLFFLLGIAGFAWLALVDIPVEQKDVVKEIPYESLTHAP
jgi:hypothetical protein